MRFAGNISGAISAAPIACALGSSMSGILGPVEIEKVVVASERRDVQLSLPLATAQKHTHDPSFFVCDGCATGTPIVRVALMRAG